MIRGDSGRATPHWEACFNLAREHGMQQPLLISAYGLAWVRWRTGVEKAEAQAAKMRDLRAQIREGHYRLFNPLSSVPTLIEQSQLVGGNGLGPDDRLQRK